MTDTTTKTSADELVPPMSIWTKLAYGFGASAYGVKENGFGYVLMLFYGTVLGVDARLIGLALFIALAFDALSDPIVGYLSDNWRSKWGRRHPFMYAAAIPVSVSYFLLWNPPLHFTDTQMFGFVVVLSVIIRTLITFYETPSSALTPELTHDYDQRTVLQTFRLFFGWVIGNLMSVILFAFLLIETATYGDGIMNREGYRWFGIIGSVLMFASIMVCALGTHKRIPHLKPPPEKRKLTLPQIFSEIIETLSDKSFGALFLASLLSAIASGVAAACSFILLSFFWELTESQRSIWTLFVFVSALIGLIVAPMVSRTLGKKRGVIILGAIAFSVAPLPVLLRLLGIFPENGDPILFPLLVTINTLDIGLIIAVQALFSSMIADLVEQNELKTGRRSEGIFYASVTFIRKSGQGLGAFAAGFVLAFAAIPEGVQPGDASSDALFRLGLGYAPTLLCLWAGTLIAVSFYKISRESHEANLKELERRRAEAASMSTSQ